MRSARFVPLFGVALAYDFPLRPANLAMSGRVPAYVLARLAARKRSAPARERVA